MRPTLTPEPGPSEVKDNLTFMAYRSFTSPSIKLAVVMGIVAWVDIFTLPSEDKPIVLKAFLRRLVNEGLFPVQKVRRWALDASVGFRFGYVKRLHHMKKHFSA